HALTGILAAKNRGAVQAAVTALPIYTFVMVVAGLLGLVALANGVTPVGADRAAGAPGDPFTIMPRLIDQMFPDWGAGTAYAATVVGAFVPAPVMSIPAANLFSRNIYREFFRPQASPAEQTMVSRLFSLLIKFVAIASVLLLGAQFSVDTGAIVILQT